MIVAQSCRPKALFRYNYNLWEDGLDPRNVANNTNEGEMYALLIPSRGPSRFSPVLTCSLPFQHVAYDATVDERHGGLVNVDEQRNLASCVASVITVGRPLPGCHDLR